MCVAETAKGTYKTARYPMTSDMGDAFREHRKFDKKRRADNRSNAYERCKNNPRWRIHSDTHFATNLLGDLLDYWPGRQHWKWRGKNYYGDVFGFIKNREPVIEEQLNLPIR
jgi:hypothetical protein